MIKCQDCEGRGRWEERAEDKAGVVTVLTKFCNTCNGRGFVVAEDEQDVYDIDGEQDDD